MNDTASRTIEPRAAEMSTEALTARITSRLAELDQAEREAERTLVAIRTAIQELQQLIAPVVTEGTEPPA